MVRAVLAVLAVVLPVLLGGAEANAAPGRPIAPATLRPGCQYALISENSGNGPTFRVIICDALKTPAGDHRWVLVNDGAGAIDGGDVLLGFQVRH